MYMTKTFLLHTKKIEDIRILLKDILFDSVYETVIFNTKQHRLAFLSRKYIGYLSRYMNTSDYRELKIVFNLKAAPKNGFAFDNVGFKPRPHHTREICKPCTIIHHETGAFLKCTNRGNSKTLASSFGMEVRLKNGDKTITVCDLPT